MNSSKVDNKLSGYSISKKPLNNGEFYNDLEQETKVSKMEVKGSLNYPLQKSINNYELGKNKYTIPSK